MTTFVLVHGGFHGSWCWQSVAHSLRDAGHQVDAVDLPGRPGGPQHPTIDLASYVRVVTDAIDRAGESVVLVAHSLGGVSAALAAEARHTALSRLVFVNSLLSLGGNGALATMLDAGQDSILLREGALVPAPDGLTIFADSPETAMEAFFHRCDPTDAKAAVAQLVPEPMAPLVEVHEVSRERFGSVPKVYVGADADRVVPWSLQHRIAEEYSMRFVALGGDHSPFFSATDDLVGLLAEL